MPSTTSMTIEQKNNRIQDRLKLSISAINIQERLELTIAAIKEVNLNSNDILFPNNSIPLFQQLASAIQGYLPEEAIISTVSEIKSPQQLHEFFQLYPQMKKLQYAREALFYDACALVWRYANPQTVNFQNKDEIKLLNDTLALAILAVSHEPLDKQEADKIEKGIKQLIKEDDELFECDRLWARVLMSVGYVLAIGGSVALYASIVATLFVLGAVAPLALIVCIPAIVIGIALAIIGSLLFSHSKIDANRYADHASFFKQVKNFSEKEQALIKTSKIGLFAKTENVANDEPQKVTALEQQTPIQNKYYYMEYSH